MHKPLFNCLNRQSESLFCWQCSQQNKRKQPTNLAFSQQGIPTNVRHLTLHIYIIHCIILYIYIKIFFVDEEKGCTLLAYILFFATFPRGGEAFRAGPNTFVFFFMEKKGRKKRNHYTCLRSKKEESENGKMKKKCRPHPAFIRASSISQTSCKLFLHFYFYINDSLRHCQDQFATRSSFVTENVGVSLLNRLHRVFFVDERS